MKGRRFPTPVPQPAQRRHVGMVLRPDKLELYLDGNRAGEVPVTPLAMKPVLILRGGPKGMRGTSPLART